MNKTISFLFFLSFLLISACHRHAELKSTPFKYFQDKGKLVHLTIETDMSLLFNEDEDPEYQAARLTLKKEKCADEHFHLKIKPRGVYRRANCSFPPLRIRFPDEVLEEGKLKDYPTLKLVGHCEEDSLYEQLVVKEHLIYQMYNELTDNSYRSQLVKVTYCDTEKQYPNVERFGLLLEHNRELSDRINGKILGTKYGTPKQINLPAYKVFVLFQYMIGNTDWGLSNRHNVKLIQPNEDELKLPIPIPYDFDFCGLVNAPYAIPHHNHPIENVRERYFQWRAGDADFTDVFELFKSKKERLLGIVEQCPHLTDEVKADALAYLSSFFEELETPEVIVAAGR